MVLDWCYSDATTVLRASNYVAQDKLPRTLMSWSPHPAVIYLHVSLTVSISVSSIELASLYFYGAVT